MNERTRALIAFERTSQARDRGGREQPARQNQKPRPAARARCERGAITAFVVVMATTLILVTGLVLDGGLVLSARLRALGHAQEAARAGAQAIDLRLYRDKSLLRLDHDRAVAKARAFLASIGADGTATARENVVTVTVRRTQPTQLLKIAGLTAVTVDATASARPERGISAVIP